MLSQTIKSEHVRERVYTTSLVYLWIMRADYSYENNMFPKKA